jgi:glyoxylase-like metal-dependent hydrolase (beta-lactamase superfamily II)
MLSGQDLRSQALRIARLSSRVVIVSGGSQDNNVTAIRTENGIVVVDTLESPEIGRNVRSLIEKEFRGIPFVYVINTHPDWDHVLGNPAFPEALIVAHENCLDAMVEFKEPIVGKGLTTEKKEIQKERKTTKNVKKRETHMPPPPPRLYPQVTVKSEDYKLTVPDITFSDRLSISCGDVNIELIYYGPSHTYSDILILVPEEKLLFVGDLFFRKWLPSCSSVIKPDVLHMRAVLHHVIDGPVKFDHVISGHGEIIPRKEFELQVDYLLSLWDSISKAAAEGRDYACVQKEFAIEKKYPKLVYLNIKDSRGYTVHKRNLEKIWKHLHSDRENGDGPQQIPNKK